MHSVILHGKKVVILMLGRQQQQTVATKFKEAFTKLTAVHVCLKLFKSAGKVDHKAKDTLL